jgi:effector-binding domain-containing protein
MFDGAAIRIIDLPPLRLAGIRRQASLMSVAPMAASAPVWSRIAAAGLRRGLPVVYFPDGASDAIFSEPGAPVQIGVEIFEPFEDPVLEQFWTPGGRAATATHPGDHDVIACLHHEIRRFCTAHGRALAGPMLEMHHWHIDVERRLTDIYYLLA